MKIRMLAGAAVFLLLASSGLWLLLRQKTFDARYMLLRNPFAQNFLHTVRSFDRFSNILFMPYWFRSGNLPVYELALSPKDLLRLNEHLPRDAVDGQQLEGDKFDVKGGFIADGYQGQVKVRYRGKTSNHWNAEQRSFKVKFSKDNLFHGMRELNLVIPYDRQYFVEPLNMYRAKKFGLRAPELSFVDLKLHGKSSGGVYLAFEGFGKEWLDKQDATDEFLIFTVADTVRQEPGANPVPLLSEDGLERWKIANVKNATPAQSEELRVLVELLTKADDAAFERLAPHLVDLEAFYGWEMANVLAASAHQDDYWNLAFVFNSITGRFEPIPWDVETDLDSRYVLTILREPSTLLARRILSIPAFHHEFRKRLAAYVSDPKNLEDDLRFYDGLFEKTRIAFYKDNAKFFSTLAFRRQVGEYRAAIVRHFETAREAVKDAERPLPFGVVSVGAAPAFGGSFGRFAELAYSQNEFLSRHQDFYAADEKTIVLPAGNHFFRQSVFIPAGLRLVIQPGASLYLGDNASFISFGPVDARGAPNAPIRVRPANVAVPFGTFAVQNAGREKSFFEYFDIRGGNQAHINGVYYKGMMTTHNSDVAIRYARFADAHADDAINAEYGSIEIGDSWFEGNASDNIDLDFMTGSLDNSYFKNPNGGSNGDAIDLSGSRVGMAGNTIEGCGDKGFSIGERSFARLRHNVVSGCAIGVAVKDSSEAFFVNNSFVLNKTAIEAYQKKPVFGGGTIWMAGTVVWGNNHDVSLDKKSSLVAVQSVFEHGIAGDGNTQEKPDFSKLLPASVYEAVKDKL